MNDLFSFSRFGLLFRKTILERPAQLLGLLGLTLAITLLTYVTIKWMLGIGKAQVTAFTVGFIAGGSFMASSVYGYFSSNAGGTSFLMLPASHLEKWLSGVIITGILFTALFLGFFRLLDLFFVNSYHQSLDPESPAYQSLYQAIDVLNYNSITCRILFVMFANICGAMLVGSLYFNKVSFIKVALIICALVAAVFFTNWFFVSLFFKQVDMAVPFKTVFLKVGNDVGLLDLPPLTDKIIFYIMAFIFPAALWLTAYIRLTEKEI